MLGEQLTLGDGTGTPVAPAGRVVVTASAPPVEVRVIDPWRLGVGGHRLTLDDRYGRPMVVTVDQVTVSAVLPAWAVGSLPGTVARLTDQLAAATSAPPAWWTWTAHPQEQR